MSEHGRRVRGVVIAPCLALFAPGLPAQPVHVPADQTPPRPMVEEPAPSPFQPVTPEASRPVAETSDDGNAITRITVQSDKGGENAVPPPGWTPPLDKGGRLVLSHRSGQPLDGTWVQSQFDRAAGSGGLRPSRAVALLQLINRAYISAGFINSGLLVEGRDESGGGDLAVRLVFGQLAEGPESMPAMAVEFLGDRPRGLSADFVRARFASTRTSPLNAFALERDFRLLDEDPAIRSISAALSPGDRPGEASLRLIVNPAKRLDLYAGASNDRSPSVGGDRLFTGGHFRNLISSGDLVSFEAGMTRGIEDGQASFSTPAFNTAMSLGVRGSFNNAAVVTSALAPLDIKAKDRSAEIGLTWRLVAEPLMVRGGLQRWSASEALSAGVFLLRRRQKSFLLGEPFSFAPGSVDGRSEFDAVRISGDYLRRDQRRVIALSLGATVGLDGTRSDIPGIPNPRRQFVALLGQFNFAQRINDSFELRGRITGQHSRGTLYSGLRLSVGGATTVRGYRENLFLVDRGAIGSLEMAYNFSLGGNGRRSGFDWGAFSLSAFIDGARFRNAEPPQPDDRWIASIGPALAWTPSPAFQASVAYGHALKQVAVPGDRSLQDRGIHFRIVTRPLDFF